MGFRLTTITEDSSECEDIQNNNICEHGCELGQTEVVIIIDESECGQRLSEGYKGEPEVSYTEEEYTQQSSEFCNELLRDDFEETSEIRKQRSSELPDFIKSSSQCEERICQETIYNLKLIDHIGSKLLRSDVCRKSLTT